MRPDVRLIGVCTTALPTMVGPNGINYADTSQLREKSFQLVDASVVPGAWSAGTVALEASLDGGVTWGTFFTASAPGFIIPPAVVLGKVRAVASGLPAAVRINVWLGALDARTDQ